MLTAHPHLSKGIVIFSLIAGMFGLVLRFYSITSNDFIFYDEGYYLNWTRPLGEALAAHHLKGEDMRKAVDIYVTRSLGSGKALWFLLTDSRFFWGGFKDLFFARLLAAIFGTATLGMTYLFAKRFFDSSRVAGLAMSLLAILPSHVFYSRVGMQEALSTFLVLAGFYCYFFPRSFGWRTLAAGAIWGMAFFANYRLIILPVVVALAEFYWSFSLKERPAFRKYLWALLIFFACVFGIGNLKDGQNTIVVFSWIWHQADMAREQWNWINLLSYPYYIFRLETALFGIFFFGNLYFACRRQWRELLPFFLVCVQMGIFSFASEKGARYLCVMTPFMAMSVAALGYRLMTQQRRLNNFILVAFFVVMSVLMVQKSMMLAQHHSDYRSSAEFLLARDPGVKFLSTQNYVQNLYVEDQKHVEPCPHGFDELVKRYHQGFRYLVVCPQAYISWTEKNQRFHPRLEGYLEFIRERFKPVEEYSHFNDAMLERFVFDHNENLARSIRFLKISKDDVKFGGFGVLRVYDLSEVVPETLKALSAAPSRRP